MLCSYWPVPNAAHTADPARKRKPPKANPYGEGMLSLLRKLAAYGQELAAHLKTCEGPHPPLDIFHRFGSLSLALIITRITRGLLLAAALEARLIRRLPTNEDRPLRTRPAAPSPARTRRSGWNLWVTHDHELEGPMPSAEEIAERIRRRPAGAVIAEICRDLGIDTRHELWREINDILRPDPLNLARMLVAWKQRGEGLAKADPTLSSMTGIYPPPAAATHPP